MRKLKLMLAPNTSIEVSADWFKDLREGRLGGLYSLIDRLGFGVLLLAVALLPLLDANSGNTDSLFAYFLLLGVTAMVGFVLMLVVLTKWHRLSDPPIFLPILSYAFLVLAAFLIVPASANNTFGADNAKYLSGVVVMALAGLYYLINVLTNTPRRMGWLVKGVMLSLFLVMISPVLSQDSTGMLFPVAVLLTPVFLLYFLKSNSNILRAASFVAMVVGVWISFQPDSDIYTKVTVIIGMFVMLLAWLASTGWQIKRPIASFREDWNKYIETKIGISELLESSTMLLFAVFWILWIVFTIFWTSSTQLNLITEFNTVTTEIRNAFASLEGTELFVGTGAGSVVRDVAIANLIRFQGLLGVGAYTLLAISGYYLIMTSFFRKNASIAHIYAPFLFGLPILALMSTLTLPMVIIWWIMLAVLAKRLTLSEAKVELLTEMQIGGFKFGRLWPYIQIVLIVAIAVGWYFLAGSIQALYLSGII